MWGARGALNPKSSHAGLNSPPEGGCLSGQHREMSMMKVGSCAAGRRELGQVRKEAALSGRSRVPQECLAGVGSPERAGGPPFEGGVHGAELRRGRPQTAGRSPTAPLQTADEAADRDGSVQSAI